MHRLIALAVAGMVVMGVSQLHAHDEYRIIGTVMKVQANAIDVKDRDGRTTVITIDKQTRVERNKTKVDVSEVKTGRYVVVDALGDSEEDLLAIDIRLVPAPTK